jgi:hypothetical protein
LRRVAILVAISLVVACGGQSLSAAEDGSVYDRASPADARAADERIDEVSVEMTSHDAEATSCPSTPTRTGPCSLPAATVCSYGFAEPSSSPMSCGGIQIVCRNGQWTEDLHSDPGPCCASLGANLLAMNGCLDAGADAREAGPTDGSAAPLRGCDGASDASFSIDSASLEADVACLALAGSACVSCCADKNRTGRAELDLVGRSCMCTRCSASCTSITCDVQGLPQTPCIACVKQSLAGDCACNGYLDQFCGDIECRTYLNCIMSCSD